MSSNHVAFSSQQEKGKGGRRPAKDPRLDPSMDQHKAKRILAIRKSTARSKRKRCVEIYLLQPLNFLSVKATVQ